MRGTTTVAVALLAAGLLAAPAARGDDSAAAEALFQQAKVLTEAQRWAEACPKFAASYKLDGTLGTLLNLADCEEHVDRIATAWAHFGEALEMAQKTGDKRAEYAAKRRAALAPKLPMIRLDVNVGKSKLTVQRDGVKIDAAAFGVPLPSDPGPHAVTVWRDDEKLVERSVTAKAGETVGVVLDLEAIERAAPPPTPPPSGTQRKVGFALLGVGAGFVALAAGLEIGALVSKSQAGSAGGCLDALCTPTGYEAVSRARTLANVGQWMGIGGIVLAAVGIPLAVTAPPGKREPRAASNPGPALFPWVGPGAGGIAVGGAL